MAKLSRDQSPAGNLHPRETLYVTGNLAAINSEVQLACDGMSSFAIDVRGVYTTGVWNCEGTVDGTNWTVIPIRPYNQAGVGYILGPAAATQGVWVGRPGPFKTIRVRMTVASTANPATVTITASTGLLDDTLQNFITTTTATTVGAAGAAVTLTIASPGAGLRHYLTYLRIVRFAAAVLTPAATPVTVTTTNIPGTPAFSIPADAAAQGTISPYQEDFNLPIAVAAQATATTIVCPATTNVIWRVTAGYYVAP